MEIPTTYLGTSITQMDNVHGDLYWAMSSDQYYTALVANIEEELQKKNL